MQSKNNKHQRANPGQKRIGYLRKILQLDRASRGKTNGSPWTYYNTSLEHVNVVFGLKLQNQIARHYKKNKDPNYQIIDLGAGSGRTVRELSAELTKLGVKTKLIGTVLKKTPELTKNPTPKNITWTQLEFGNLISKIPENSINFAYSNFGIRHAQDIRKTLEQVHKLLKKGGRIIFTHRSKIPASFTSIIPPGFKPVGKNAIHLSEEINQDSVYESAVIYIEKI